MVVGQRTSFENGGSHSHPVLWNEERGSVTLESLFDELGIDGSVYESCEFTDVSCDGSTVIANCVKDMVDIGIRVRIAEVFP